MVMWAAGLGCVCRKVYESVSRRECAVVGE